MESHPVGVELFFVDGRTDITKLIVVFRNFANAPKNQYRSKCPCENAYFISIGRKFISGDGCKNKKWK